MEDLVNVDVFISYSSKNKTVADAVVSNFEQNGIRCWYAPRDIMPGKEWVTAIKEGIHSAKVFVLLFTEESNNSRQVMNEVAMAFNVEKTIVPFKLTEKEMSGELEYYLTRVHWLDAVSKPLKNNIDELRKFVEIILSGANPHATLNRELLGRNIGENGANKKGLIIPLAIGAVLVIAVIVILLLKPFGSDEKGSQNANGMSSDVNDGIKNNQEKDDKGDGDKVGDDGDEISNTPDDAPKQEEYVKLNDQAKEYYLKDDYQNALEYFLKSVECGNTDTATYYYIGRIYNSERTDDEEAEEKALKYLELAYNDGGGEKLTADEYYLLAYKYDSDESVKNPEKMFKFALEGAEAGSVQCMRMVGEAYWYGNGVAQDYDQVLLWFGKALDSGVEGYTRNYCINAIESLVEEGHVTSEAASKWLEE